MHICPAVMLFDTVMGSTLTSFTCNLISYKVQMANVVPGYRGHGEFQFLKMMAEEIEKGYIPGSIFRPESQVYVFRKFRAAFGAIYSDRFLRSRFKHLKKRYHEFSELLNQEGIYWNKKQNVVHGNETILRTKYRARFRNGAYIGEENFDLMCQIFESGVEFNHCTSKGQGQLAIRGNTSSAASARLGMAM
ncbi:UNVERIFIED_CONTAM: hypothetical protein Scaly_1721700 [Sesamum calycinum]|uniref:Myb/SANT-like domain-containing protein n=1 Tax=Sesamum calycinum TaxID=2727403 RepID=A0AAW2NT63_9LAMI